MRPLTTLALAAAAALPVLADGAPDVNWRIRREAVERSAILDTLHVLTDLHGPRLTGSPNLRAAQEWAATTLRGWGLAARLEPWTFGYPGWTNERLAAHVVSPVKDALVAEALAWTPGTNGPVNGEVYHLKVPERPTQAELDAFFAGVGDAVRGRIVLAGDHAFVPVTFYPPALRRDEQELRAQYDAIDPAPPPPFRPRDDDADAAGPRRLTERQVSAAVDTFLVARQALARVNDAGRGHSQIRAFNNRTFDESRAVPTVVLRNEDYGRIARLLAGGRAVTLELDIVNRTWPEGRTEHNVIAEIPGTDLRNQIVMLGGHLDSWHAATGATDNGIGVAVTMEAVRILQAIGVRPRRTIRLALWSGEEQGLLGSAAYVKEHFGSAESPGRDFANFVGYVNVDSGTGRVRGMSVFGPPQAAAVLREVLAPFADLGVVGAAATTSRRRGGSDHTSFNAAGLPGIGVAQDPIEYRHATWHTNLDTYERIVEEDAQKSAIAVAATVYALAMRDGMLPRFAPQDLPKAVPSTEPRDRPVPVRPPSPTP
jgi:hypothetical protein